MLFTDVFCGIWIVVSFICGKVEYKIGLVFLPRQFSCSLSTYGYG